MLWPEYKRKRSGINEHIEKIYHMYAFLLKQNFFLNFAPQVIVVIMQTVRSNNELAIFLINICRLKNAIFIFNESSRTLSL